MSEKITREPDSEWIRCVPGCDNTPDMDGFQPCMPDGTPAESVAGGAWDGNVYACSRCGRIVNQVTLEVLGRLATIHMSDSGYVRCGVASDNTTYDMSKVTCEECKSLTPYTDAIRAIQQENAAGR